MTATADPPRAAAASAAMPASPRSLFATGISWLASMRLTVVLLLCFFVLTFAGTLAQIDLGLYVVQRDFFESLWVVWDTGLRLGKEMTLHVPLPGGYLLMGALFVNLMVGGVVRLRWQSRNVGVLIVHLGMALLLIAGFVKLEFSYAGMVSVYEKAAEERDPALVTETRSMVSFHEYELALLRRDGERIVERTVAAEDLAGAHDGAVRIDDPALPFVVQVSHYLDNCWPQRKGPMFEVDVPVVTDPAGVAAYLQRRDIRPEREQNVPGCYVTVIERKGRQEHQGIVLGADFRPQADYRMPFTFTVDGTTWGLDLRRVTWDLPFRVRLDRFQKTDHPGTPTPRDFSSWVTVSDDQGSRPVHIYMNHPLRRDGYVAYQTSWGPDPRTGIEGPPFYSVFEVAKNPSDAWPEFASYVILLGLIVHFGGKLLRYLRSSSHRATLPEMS